MTAISLGTIPVNAPPAFHLLAKPTGAICNLDCAYCFFLDKEVFYPDSKFRMSDDVLEAYLRQLIESHQTNRVTIAWQGGEPTLMGLNYLCAGFMDFFHYVDFPMKLMAGLIRRKRPATEVMTIMERAFAGVGRNDPCPCNNGRKFKLCHGRPQPKPSTIPLPSPQTRSELLAR